MLPDLPHAETPLFIDGRWQAGRQQALAMAAPGNLDLPLPTLRQADPEQARQALAAARQAAPIWENTPKSERVALLGAWIETLRTRSDTLAETITTENGKTLREARAEVAATLADADYQLRFAAEQPDRESPPGAEDREMHHRGLGLVLAITPWNFPLAVVLRKLLPALLWGNALVHKASEITPHSAIAVFDALQTAGLPRGVANLLIGDGAQLGPTLLEGPIDAVTFTGSTVVGREIQSRIAGRPIRLQAEMGGKNPLIVLADADLQAAADATILGAFSCAGQWCTGTSRAIIERDIYQPFCEMLRERATQLCLGPPTDPETQIGAVTSAPQYEKILRHIRQARQQGARLLAGGQAPPAIDGCRGHFIQPTLFADVTPEMDLFHEEVFGPVLALSPARDLEHAIALANHSQYGLTSSIFTTSQQAAERYLRDIRSGLAHINRHTAFRTPDMPLLGIAMSGAGTPECGRYARDFYARPVAVYFG